MLDFATILRAPTFKFLVGSDGTCFNVPATLAKDISPPLYALMNGSQMKEAKDGVAVLKEVESETFTAFCEYAYTGSYRVPKVTVDFEQSTHGSPSHHSTYAEPEPSAMEPEAAEPHAVEAMPEPGQLRVVDEYSWGLATKKDKKHKKKGLQQEPTVSRGEDPQAISAGETAYSYNIHKRHDHLWNEFCNLKYDGIPDESEERSSNLDPMTEMEFKPLLFHCKLYLFAQMYLMASLKQLTLCKLHEALESFHLDLESSGDVLEMIEFAFTNTERGEERDDELRKLVVAYAVSKTRILKQNSSFRTLLDAHGELGSDIVQVLG